MSQQENVAEFIKVLAEKCGIDLATLVARAGSAPQPCRIGREPYHDDDECMSFKEWCRRNGISLATGRRILASGKGPPVVQLSSKRIGITFGSDREWKASRVKQFV
jgi:hypothetical protein